MTEPVTQLRESDAGDWFIRGKRAFVAEYRGCDLCAYTAPHLHTWDKTRGEWDTVIHHLLPTHTEEADG